MRVVYLGHDPNVFGRLRQTLDAWGDLTHCLDQRALQERLAAMAAAGEGGVVVLDVTSLPPDVNLAALAETRRRAQGMGWVLVADVEPESVRKVVLFAPAGIDAVVLRGHDDTAVRFRHVALHAFRQGIARHCADRLGSALPRTLTSIINACARCAVSRPTASGVAVLAGLSRDAARDLLRDARIRSLRSVIGSCRALAASCFVGWSRLPTEDIADAMSFPSANGLRDTLRRYTGLTVAGVRTRQCSHDEVVQRVVLRLRTYDDSDLRSQIAGGTD